MANNVNIRHQRSPLEKEAETHEAGCEKPLWLTCLKAPGDESIYEKINHNRCHPFIYPFSFSLQVRYFGFAAGT